MQAPFRSFSLMPVLAMTALLYLPFVTKSQNSQPAKVKSSHPKIFTGNFTNEIKEGEQLDCKITDMSIMVFLSKNMKKYDVLEIELVQYGSRSTNVISYVKLQKEGNKYKIPLGKKEFRISNSALDTFRLSVISKKSFPDFKTMSNTLSTENYNFCMGDKRWPNHYFTVTGYTCLNKKDKYGNCDLSEGTDLGKSMEFIVK